MSRFVKIIPRDSQLVVFDKGYELRRFPIATARYDWQPKYWSNDYRNLAGRYKVSSLHGPDSKLLKVMNDHFVPWYLSPTAKNPYEDAGTGVYGTGMIIIDYPNSADLARYEKAKKCGELRNIWNFFCKNHLLPIYDRISLTQEISPAKVKVETDYGNQTYPELLESFPIQDPKVAFQLGVAIHGTNDPPCIGTAISAGCIRMHNNDIMKLMAMVEIGTEIIFEGTDFYSM